MGTASHTSNRPYFFWDYDISDAETRRILQGGSPSEKAWVIGRILEYAKPANPFCPPRHLRSRSPNCRVLSSLWPTGCLTDRARRRVPGPEQWDNEQNKEGR